MRIAVVGSGIAGLSAAWMLSREHAVVVFERDTRPGGHAHTHTVSHAGAEWTIDTGFLVFNERTYPNFIRLLSKVGIQGAPSDMSFSVRCRKCRLEWGSRDVRAWFAQPWRAFDPGHLGMLLDVTRFFRRARAFLDEGRGHDVTVGTFLDEGGYGHSFARHFLLPMTGAIWSASFASMRQFPARAILQFLDNHGLLAGSGAPQWFTIPGGSRRYVHALAQGVSGGLRTGCGVRHITRQPEGASLVLESGETLTFDKVVIATHADQALRMLTDASDAERDLLGRFRYSDNHAVLHTDVAALPERRAAWASWNCELADCADESGAVALTYHINRLQSVGPVTRGPQFCVSLNHATPPGAPALAEMHYTHPILDRDAVAAQPRLVALNGTRHTYYCGAHLRYGFHEDGVVSALDVVRRFGVEA